MGSMADSRRWGAGPGVRRDDQFTRPPAFRDGLDSKPMAADSSWHGGPSHHVAFAVGLAILAAVGAVAFMLLAPGGGEGGVGPASGVAAEGPGGPLDEVQPPGAAGNATSSLPSASPAVPGLPALP